MTNLDMDDCPDWPIEFSRHYIKSGHWKDLTFIDLIKNSAEQYPDNVALVDQWERVTYTEFYQRILRGAKVFSSKGLTYGDNVVIQITNRIAFAEVFFALLYIGVRPVLALPAHRKREIDRFVEISEADAYITEDDQSGYDYRCIAREITQIHSKLKSVFIIGEAEEFEPFYNTAIDEELATPAAKSDDIACFQLSGGTTGFPKLIPRRHREYLYNVRESVRLCNFNDKTIYLVVLPTPHNFPLCCPGFIGALQVGGKIVFSSSSNPEDVFPLIRNEKVTATALVPPLAIVWTEAIRAYGYSDLESLRLLQIGGAKLTIEAAKRVNSAFRCQLQQVFGMAEGLVCYTRLDDPIYNVLETQGRPLSPEDEVKIVDSSDQEVSPGIVGSLLTRGPYTIRGYFRAKEHNYTAFTNDGFYRTGDLARITNDGNIVVEGRDKDQINRGGEKISAEEVEDILLSHSNIVDAAVISIPDVVLGEKICAFIIIRDSSLSIIDIRTHFHKNQVASFKIPDRIEIVNIFPETGIGKTSRKNLREILQKVYLEKNGDRK